MKKVITSIIGIALSLAAYHQNRRQTEYISSQATLATPVSGYTAQPITNPIRQRALLAFGLSKPS